MLKMKLYRTLCTIIMTVALVKREVLASSEATEARIYGGVPVKQGDAPFQVSFQDDEGHFCGGSIIDPNYILTAAHCCEYALESDSLKIVAGLNHLYHPENGFQQVTVPVSGIRLHPDYTGAKLKADICILQLKNPLILSPERRTATIKLPPPGYTASEDANVTGWGLTTDGTGNPPDDLMRVKIPIVPDNVCRERYPAGTIVDEMICAGDTGKGACYGDSGGPLVDYQGFLVGVVKGGRECGSAKYPGVFTEVSYFTQWIKDHIVSSTLEDPVSS